MRPLALALLLILTPGLAQAGDLRARSKAEQPFLCDSAAPKACFMILVRRLEAERLGRSTPPTPLR